MPVSRLLWGFALAVMPGLTVAACTSGEGSGVPADSGIAPLHLVFDARASAVDAPAHPRVDAGSGHDASAGVDATAFDASVRAEADAGDAGQDVALAPIDAGVDSSRPTQQGVYWTPIDASLPDDGAVSATYPAFRPDVPHLRRGTGPVLSAPVFVPIVFQGDPYLDSIAAFVPAVGPSKYWNAATSEYGVGAASSTAPIVVDETPPVAIDDTTGIQPWLAAKLASDPRFAATAKDAGAGDAGALTQTVYMIYYPSTTTITSPLGTSCSTGGPSFGGYHSSFAPPGETATVLYAVLARCPAFVGAGGVPLVGFDFVSDISSHEMAEAATDPMVDTANEGLDYAHTAWQAPNGGAAEVGDMCEYDPQAYIHPTEAALSSFVVQRIWSNASFAAGHDPCVPALPGEVFYGAVPVLPDRIDTGDIGVQGGGEVAGSTPGVRVPVGGSTTIELAIFSDGPTGGGWTVGVAPFDADELEVTLAATQGQNGSLIPLTLTAPPGSYRGVQYVSVSSTATSLVPVGGMNTWYLAVLTY